MGEYFLQDIAYTFTGDLQLDSKGDLKLASSFDTQLSLANFWLRTDHGDYAASFNVGCNLGEFIGGQNTERTLDEMRDQTFDVLTRNIFFPEDIAVETAPLYVDEVLVAVQIRGSYLNEDGTVQTITPQILTYSFPFIDATVLPLS